ncbi:MAG: YciI family protein [Chloroflexi bacterium]|nr:YciI family protein [Chloroflexota bacterium]
MRYMMLIYGDESGYESITEAQMAEAMATYNAFGAEAQARGVLLSGDALQATHTATTVRVRNGETMTTDGPFAETKEALGGFYILNCKDLDEALEFAAKIPGAKSGSVEVRPIMEFN